MYTKLFSPDFLPTFFLLETFEKSNSRSCVRTTFVTQSCFFIQKIENSCQEYVEIRTVLAEVLL